MERETKQWSQETIQKFKPRRLRAITLQGAIERKKYYYCNIGKIDSWRAFKLIYIWGNQ